MADVKELLGGLLGKAKDVMDTTGVTQVYQKGAERTRIYARIARLTRESGSTDQVWFSCTTGQPAVTFPVRAWRLWPWRLCVCSLLALTHLAQVARLGQPMPRKS